MSIRSLTVACAFILVSWTSHSHTTFAQTNANSSVSSVTQNPAGPVVAAPKTGSAPVQQSPLPLSQLTPQTLTVPTVLNPSAPVPAGIALPADIESLTAKDILTANNQVVSHIATMYQHFGLFITIIVGLVGAVATWVGYLARKSVHEFVQEWTTKVQVLEAEIKDCLKRVHQAVDESESSASDAAKHAQSIKDSETILQKTLKDVDQLRSAVASLKAQLNAGESQQYEPSPAVKAEPVPTISPTDGHQREKPEEDIEGENAQVSERLKGRINTPPAEGGRS